MNEQTVSAVVDGRNVPVVPDTRVTYEPRTQPPSYVVTAQKPKR